MEVGRQEVLDRPGLQDQGRHARPAWPRASRRRRFDKAIFTAKKDKLTGPVKTQFGCYVFDVSKITTAKQQTLEESKASIKQILASQNQQSALKKFGKDYRKRYKKETDCRKGYVVDDCKNAPKKKAAAQTTTTPGGAEQPAADAGHHDDLAVGRAPAATSRLRHRMPEPAVAAAVARLDELTRRLRRECPWDREQDERSIVPHTVEEAYELADAANAGDDAKLLDELGDVLFQVHFLSLLLEERGAGDLAQVAEHVRQKLIRRHPHVFGEVEAADRRRGAAQLGRDQARRARPRGGDLRRGPREPARAAARAQGPAPRRDHRLRLRPASPTTRSPASSRSSRRPATSATRSSTRSATCSSPPSTSRASCASTPSSRCAPPAGASAAASRRPRRWRRAAGAEWEALDPRRQARLLRPSPAERGMKR